MPASSLTAYRLTPAARNDLEDIWLYTAKRWSMVQADRYTDILEDTFDRLLFMPEMARERPEFDPPVRIHPSAEHLIIYRIEEGRLVILRILGAGQDWQAILRAVDQ
ncbi:MULTISPECIES: type II toxin-antitoxin system RelE/ParE family toxin [Rhodovulum]|uniref:Toxin n=1 Tax=Rhodovulum adriaticum TaxID=35804 RepID=A0A4R2NNJ8_RHOAD|nr:MULTISPECIES: type II toxin-antitoxin system RelE/ParE family toxin [Rhodovulum]MBK1634375.1 type II toxin-antitoxin system RelE/ParE family toxin [Rhodovulum adriaticum]TCP23257.1 toxin ParE1/3/4 [Rhodovulum adriaticum]SIN99975.1 toxin ParE1/3/4 [Rhodovulum sp. ES.010]